MKHSMWFVMVMALLVAGAAQADLIITEVMQNPAAVGDGEGEYFELYNSGDSELNLNGYIITDADSDSFSVETDVFVAPGAYVVFGVNGDFAVNGGVNVDYVYAGMFLSNSADELIIADAGGNLLDEIWWDGGPNWPDPTGASMSLIDMNADNNDPTNWREANTPFGDGDFGTPGSENTFLVDVPDLVITEIMNNPSAVSDSDGEYFEIYNNGNSEVNLNGYSVADAGADGFTIDADLFVGAGGYIVLGVNADFATNGGVNVDYAYTSFNLANGDDEVIVSDGDGNVIDEVWYDGGPEFPDPTGASMQLLDVDLDNSVGANWSEANLAWGDGTDFGTPGAMNEWDQGGEPDTFDITIAELQMNTDTYLDQIVRVSGVVTIPTGTVHAGYSDVYIQDDSGYGVNMYDGDILASDGMDRGDEYEVIGVPLQYFDTTEITEFAIMELSTGNDLPAPMTFDGTGDFHANAVVYEGTWAMIEGEIQADFDPFDGSYNFSINDGSGDALVRIWGDTDLDLLDGFAIGDNIAVYGVVDGYNGSPQMMPALLEDVMMGGDPDPVVLTLTGTDTDVPANGGNIYYDLHLVSNLPNAIQGVAYRTYATLPNGNFYGPIDTIPFTLQAGMDFTQTGLSQAIPAFAPAGDYMFHGRVGFPAMYVEDTFAFNKSATLAAGPVVEDWSHSDVNFAGDDAAAVEAMPASFELSSAYPNPFNPTTSVAVSLPAASELTVTVFNVMGQQVAELANGSFQAGQHSFTFDASSMSSGLYFIQAQVPGELNAIQKVTLMK